MGRDTPDATDTTTASTDARPPSHAMLWALVTVSVPVLYVLSCPPVTCLAYKHSNSPPAWLSHYVKPAEWLCSNPPLEKPYSAYWEWCSRNIK